MGNEMRSEELNWRIRHTEELHNLSTTFCKTIIYRTVTLEAEKKLQTSKNGHFSPNW